MSTPSETSQAAARWTAETTGRIRAIESLVISQVRRCQICDECHDPDHIRADTQDAEYPLQQVWDDIRSGVHRHRMERDQPEQPKTRKRKAAP